MGDGVGSEGGSVVRNTHHESATILVDVIDAVGDGDAQRVAAEIMIQDPPRSAFPAPAGIAEVADQFAFFGVDADDRQMTALEAVA
jgi:hypothetical protein